MLACAGTGGVVRQAGVGTNWAAEVRNQEAKAEPGSISDVQRRY